MARDPQNAGPFETWRYTGAEWLVAVASSKERMMTTLAEFKKKVKHLTPGAALVYHTGELTRDRERSDLVNKVAAFALAVDDCGFGAVFQRRLGPGSYEYQVRVFKRLGMRRDQNGSFQDAERVASLHAERIRLMREA
jgi:hypothetical protein